MENNYNEKYLHRLIELYFEGATTLEQEALMRRMLADRNFRSAPADEARAVLGVAAVLPGHTVDARGGKRQWYLSLRVAAVAAVLITTGILTGYFTRQNSSGDIASAQCFAYVGTELVQDRNKVMEIMESQLADMSAVADDVNRDLRNTIVTIKYSEL